MCSILISATTRLLCLWSEVRVSTVRIFHLWIERSFCAGGRSYEYCCHQATTPTLPQQQNWKWNWSCVWHLQFPLFYHHLYPLYHNRCQRLDRCNRLQELWWDIQEGGKVNYTVLVVWITIKQPSISIAKIYHEIVFSMTLN